MRSDYFKYSAPVVTWSENCPAPFARRGISGLVLCILIHKVFPQAQARGLLIYGVVVAVLVAFFSALMPRPSLIEEITSTKA